jgi:hypothetical protein
MADWRMTSSIMGMWCHLLSYPQTNEYFYADVLFAQIRITKLVFAFLGRLCGGHSYLIMKGNVTVTVWQSLELC